MAVDSLRETRHINRIRPQDLSTLWTAQSYRPDITTALEAVRRLPSCLPLGSMCADPIAQGRTPDYATDDGGYPCLKTKHINGLIVDDSEPDWVTLECASSLARFKVQQATVLMNRSGAGSVGRCSVYLGISAPLTNEHVLHIRVTAPHDPCFVAAYLSTWWGERAIEQGVTGSTGQLNLANEHVSRVPVPALATDAQRYIGDKVRQAERLRERARRLEAGFRNAVAVAIPSTSSVAGKTSRVTTCELGRNLNPGAHTPDRRAVRAAVRGAGGRLLETLADVESPTTVNYAATTPYVGLDAIDSATCRVKPSTAGAEAIAASARLLREGPALSRLRPYLNKVTYIPPALAGGIGSAELLLVRPKAGVDGWFLYGVLKLESSIRQLNPVATGSTHPRVDREDVVDLLVPWCDEQDALGAKLRTAQACYFASAALTATATTLVERLIDGRITEADLVAAQKALEAGDRSADREILKALRQTDAPDAKPLITDVDALYALLDGSEGQDA
jgi:type I restriction enzyme, S subunit